MKKHEQTSDAGELPKLRFVTGRSTGAAAGRTTTTHDHLI